MLRALLLFSALFGVYAARTDDMVRKYLPAGGNGKCLDGSTPTYYISRNPLSDVWVVYFMGGGYCVSPVECNSRFSTWLGSSNPLPPTIKGIAQVEDIYSGTPQRNPDFAYANRVFVPYCSGDGFLGRRTVPLAAAGWPFYFTGHYIMREVFADLTAKYGLGTKGEGEKLIIGGRSAGGVGVMQNIDAIAALYPTVNVVGYLNAAFFIDIDDFAPWTASPVFGPTPNKPTFTNNQLPNYGFLFQPFLEPQCAAANPAMPMRCIYGEAVAPHVSTPLFFAEALMDDYQIGPIHGTPPVFNSTTQQYAGYFGTIMRAYLSTQASRNGIFAPACFMHGVNWTTTMINGQTLQQHFSNWYFNNGLAKRSLDAITGVLNPTCNAWPFGLPGPAETLTDHGCVGKSARLSLANYYLRTGAAYEAINLLSEPGIFSASMWVKVNQVDENKRALISKRGETGWTLSVSEAGWFFDAYFPESRHLSVAFDPDELHLGQWQFVYISYDGSDVITIGVDSATRTASHQTVYGSVGASFGDSALNSRLYLGRASVVNEAEDYTLDTLVAEVGIWSRVLTAAEIAKIREGKARDVSVTGRLVLAYPITDALAQNVRTDQSSLLFKSTAPVVADIPSVIAARCANPGAGLAGGQK